ESRLGEITAALESIAGRRTVAIGISGLDWFPNPRNPRVFFALVHGGDALTDLARDVESALESLGIARENRPYRACSPALCQAILVRSQHPGPDPSERRRHEPARKRRVDYEDLETSPGR